MVEAAYILLTHETDQRVIDSPQYAAAVEALADLVAMGKEDVEVFAPNGLLSNESENEEDLARMAMQLRKRAIPYDNIYIAKSKNEALQHIETLKARAVREIENIALSHGIVLEMNTSQGATFPVEHGT